ncbi:MAG: hypothetical protein ABIS50_26655 [Luteolibacter sp.]|uniref:hypothetical protein n=1 Tax=Luteolibacter sp. TaxID=1962973 RepID=UPI003264D6D3
MDTILKTAAAVLLVVLLSLIGWALTHLRKIKRTLNEDGALPKPAPRANIIVLITVVLSALCALLVPFLFS